MMQKILLLTGIGSMMLLLSTVSAVEAPDTQLIDQLSGQIQDANQLKFTQAKSCESLETMLAKYAKERPDPIFPEWGFGLEGIDPVVTRSAKSALPAGISNDAIVGSSSTDFSQTNIQKSGVDEPETLKTDGKHFYYYNEKTKKISIIVSPLDIQKSTLDPKKIQLLKEIAVPRSLHSVQLFLAPDRLVVIGQLYQTSTSRTDRRLPQSERTIVALYDTSDLQNLKLLKFENLPGSYQDARLIDDQLYVVAQQGFNRYLWKKEKPDLQKNLSSVVITTKGSRVQPIACHQISYVLPEDKDLNLDPVFTIVSAMNIRTTEQKTETTALLAPSGELHMSKDALYLVSNFYTINNRNCPRGMFCAMPIFRSTTQTLIHKFARKGLALNYQNTAIVPGSLLTQYSMDEDTQGNFRILTKVWETQQATNLYVFSPELKLVGTLENIEPGEEFKSSRYIGDKLYLVTFEQIDPLFVIDLAEPKQPKILGELKIPGYSTYLHPVKKEGSKQYLLGIGYNTATNQRGGITNSGVKLSLFEIDYAKRQGEQISIKELGALTQGGKNSDSRALKNPRLFVMDKQGNVTLPLDLVEREKQGEDCKIIYDAQGKEQKKDCTPVVEPSDFFIGLKTFAITPENGIQERFAKNYFKEIMTRHGFIWTGNLEDLEKQAGVLKIDVDDDELNSLKHMRVGYAGDALYTFTPLFADFIFPNATNHYLWFK